MQIRTVTSQSLDQMQPGRKVRVTALPQIVHAMMSNSSFYADQDIDKPKAAEVRMQPGSKPG